jgi:hypothetical protein
VWTDGKAEAKPGLHANFKLSKAGERVLLIDRDARGLCRSAELPRPWSGKLPCYLERRIGLPSSK